MPRKAAAVLLTLVVASFHDAAGQVPDSVSVHGYAHLDVAYGLSTNNPANELWRTKATTPIVGRPAFNNATLWIEKAAGTASRWGLQAGLQAGEDVNNLASPAAGDAADVLKHLYYTNVSYRAPVGDRAIEITGGLIPGHLGYESFQAFPNATYTRVYGTDYVPYFEWGVSAEYVTDAPVSGALFVVNGWDYLESPNGIPSFGAQLSWDTGSESPTRANVFWGADQEDTAVEFWRLVLEAIGEWTTGDLTLAAMLGWGTEKQAATPGMPRHEWTWGAFTAVWDPADAPWSAAVRPEFLHDPDGLTTGLRQTVWAVTGAFRYRVTIWKSTMAIRGEARFDRSTGPDGGFFKGADNELVPNQGLFILAVNWLLGSGL